MLENMKNVPDKEKDKSVRFKTDNPVVCTKYNNSMESDTS